MTLQDLDKRHLLAMVCAMYKWSSDCLGTETEHDDFDFYSAWLGAGADPVTSHGRKP